ncbi:MAG: alpha/beta hydrolase-fold protein [Planctomycetota bacterium]
MPRSLPRLGFLVLLALLLAGPVPAGAGGGTAPTGRKLRDIVERYLAPDFATRRKMREEADRSWTPLTAPLAKKIRKKMLRYAFKAGPRIAKSGTNYLYPEKRGKYIVQGRPSKVLFVGLHGGGQGSGSAESAAGAMGGGGWWWIFPEVLEKTERGWTTSGTEEFVVQLIEAAKRTGKVDPDRIYICGHSMGGFGSWHIGAHHADLFAGIGAFAGAPVPYWDNDQDRNVTGIEEGVLPNLFNVRLHVYQSLDDPRVPPKENQAAIRFLKDLKKEFPGGFDFRYEEVDGRGHAAPQAGYLPALRWLAERKRNPRPQAFLWQPFLAWKRQFYWVHWDRPEVGALLEVRAKPGNVCEITVHDGADDLTGLSVLLGPPLFDLEKEVVVKVNGEERFRGKIERTFSTLLMTIPRYDDRLLFDARVDL